MKNKSRRNRKTEIATLAGGCFWCTEAVFSIVKGIEKIKIGYSGGFVHRPTYTQISTGKTGHVEAIQIEFNPEKISFEEILEIFFATHDPTTPNRQGPDIGTQYRSAIFYHNNEQKLVAKKVIREIGKEQIWSSPIITEVEPFKVFYAAEDYHKDYYKKNPRQPYCQRIINPKIVKLRQKYTKKLKPV